jgi:hypothetical protein
MAQDGWLTWLTKLYRKVHISIYISNLKGLHIMPRRKPSIVERIGLMATANPTVEIQVPGADLGDDLVSNMQEGLRAGQVLLEERNKYRDDNRMLRNEIIFRRNAIKAMTSERDNWRDRALNYMQANAEITTTLNHCMAMINSLNTVISNVQDINAALPKPEPMPERPEIFNTLDRAERTEPRSLEPSLSDSPRYDKDGRPLDRGDRPLTLNTQDAPAPTAPTLEELRAIIAADDGLDEIESEVSEIPDFSKME